MRVGLKARRKAGGKTLWQGSDSLRTADICAEKHLFHCRRMLVAVVVLAVHLRDNSNCLSSQKRAMWELVEAVWEKERGK